MSHSVNRRGFLGRAAVGSVAAATSLSASSSLFAHARSQDGVIGANDTIVIGIMGMNRGKELAPRFAKQPNVRIKYVCDVDEKRAAGAVKALEKTDQRPQPIGELQRILDDREVHALVCAAPNHWHAPATIMACNAGKHVYVEKPCSHNPAEGEWMVAAAEKNNRVVQMGSQRRSGKNFHLAMQQLHEGIIGRLYHARNWYTNDRGSIGTEDPSEAPAHINYELWQGPAPRRPFKSNVVHYNWHWNWHWGNGELGNNGVHTLDLCRWGLGVEFPIRVTSSGGRYCYTDDQITPDTQSVSWEFEDQKLITWESMSCNKHSSGFVTFYGTEGSLELDQDGTFRVYDKADKQVSEEKSPGRGDDEHIANFFGAIRADDAPLLNAPIPEGHKSTLLCHLGNIAQRVGRTMNCNPSSGHIVGDPIAMEMWEREYEPGWKPQV